ncbi:DUF2514 domain-containing protein [Pseudomonas capsici]|nr:DUF2514 domain-containing protein [Pseudomonas capsici]MCV4343345.1 DUF2514 domain-containing protein [Pseudomonas capsici]
MAGAGRLWALAIGVAALALGLWLAYSHGRSVENTEWQARWNDRNATDNQAQAVAEKTNRTEEQRRQASVNKVAEDARTQQVAAVDDAAHADAAGDRLHVAAQNFADRASCAGGDSGAAERGASTRRAAMVLSDMLTRADARAGELAEAYDRARIAGIACEKSYQALSR